MRFALPRQLLGIFAVQVEALLRNFTQRQKKRNVKRSSKALLLKNVSPSTDEKQPSLSSEHSDEEYGQFFILIYADILAFWLLS